MNTSNGKLCVTQTRGREPYDTPIEKETIVQEMCMHGLLGTCCCIAAVMTTLCDSQKTLVAVIRLGVEKRPQHAKVTLPVCTPVLVSGLSLFHLG